MELYSQFADLFEYPDERLPMRIEKCIGQIQATFPDSGKLLEQFRQAQQEIGISRLQEAYTSVFDLQPECTLNLSYHIFGEDQRRGMFLAKLKDFYSEAGIETGSELPDHLCFLLRYVAARYGSEESNAIIGDCLLPALSRILQNLKDKSSPYEALLKALARCLEQQSSAQSISGGREFSAGQSFSATG
jgi:nitrate reductase molybdenum cofactor assembly chaperone NarJ/NarW